MALFCIVLGGAGMALAPSTAAAATSFDSRYANASWGTCLDESPEFGLRPFGCNGLIYQLWTVTLNSDGTVTLKSRKTGWCVDGSKSYGARSLPCNNSDYQRWYRSYATFSGKNWVRWGNKAFAVQLRQDDYLCIGEVPDKLFLWNSSYATVGNGCWWTA